MTREQLCMGKKRKYASTNLADLLQNLNGGLEVTGVENRQRQIDKAKVTRAVGKFLAARLADRVLGRHALSRL